MIKEIENQHPHPDPRCFELIQGQPTQGNSCIYQEFNMLMDFLDLNMGRHWFYHNPET